MTMPSPGGVDFINAPQGQTEAYFESAITAKWGSKYGLAYRSYNAKNPTNTPYVNAQQFVSIILVEGLDAALAAGVGGTATLLGQVPGAAAKAAESLPTITNPLDFLRNIASFFDKLGQANTWLRIAEALLGMGLVIVGLAKLASGTAAGKAATKVGKAAMLL